jgi:hypothetical protein
MFKQILLASLIVSSALIGLAAHAESDGVVGDGRGGPAVGQVHGTPSHCDTSVPGVVGAGGGGPGGGIYERGPDGCARRAPSFWDRFDRRDERVIRHRHPGYGPVREGRGRHGWWSRRWGVYPGYACYSRDAAGRTFYGNNSSSAFYSCETSSRARGCFELGCD